jgi:hypothetical protein
MKTLYYLFLSVQIITPIILARNGLQQKQPLIQDESTFGTEFNTIKNWSGFQLSFSDQTIEVGLMPGSKIPLLLLGFPVIGDYAAEYNFKKRLALIQFDPKNIYSYLPKELAYALAQLLNIQESELNQALSKLQIRFNSIILGTVLNPVLDSPDKSYNMVYHFWGGLRHKTAENIVNFYEENMHMGLFEPVGIKPKDLIFNNFGIYNVNWHAPEHISPNNARFYVDTSKNWSSFWAIAISPDKTEISITYFLLANNTESENLIANILDTSKNIIELKQNITKALMREPEKNNEYDRQVLTHWIDTILKIIDPAMLNQLKQEELYNLERELRALKLT